MGRQGFTNTIKLSLGSAPFSDAPCSMVCFAMTPTTGQAQRLMGAYRSSVASNRHALTLAVNNVNQLECSAADAGDNHSSASSSTISANQWFHAGGTWDGSNNRRVFFNGVLENTANALRTPLLMDGFMVGSGGGNGDYNPWGGVISDAAIWNVQLTSAEMLALSKGLSPLKVRPASLIGYWPLLGISPEPDPRGNTGLTLVGAVTQGPSGPVKRRHSR